MISKWGNHLRNLEWPFPFGSQFLRQIVESKVFPFQPYFIAHFPRDKPRSYPFFCRLLSFFVCCQCFITGMFQEGESMFKRGEEGLSYFWVISQFISEDKAKQRLLHGRMSCRVVCKFCHWNEFRPLIRLSLAEHPKVHFYFLVDSFHFSICLWMICVMFSFPLTPQTPFVTPFLLTLLNTEPLSTPLSPSSSP